MAVGALAGVGVPAVQRRSLVPSHHHGHGDGDTCREQLLLAPGGCKRAAQRVSLLRCCCAAAAPAWRSGSTRNWVAAVWCGSARGGWAMVCSALVLDRGPACKLSTAGDDIATGSPSGLSTADGPPPHAPRAIAAPVHRASSGLLWPRYVLTLSHPPCCSPVCAWRGSLTTWAPPPYAPTANSCTHPSSRFESPAPASHPTSQRVAHIGTDCALLLRLLCPHRRRLLPLALPVERAPQAPCTVAPAAFPGRANQKQLRNGPAPATAPLSVTLAATHLGTARRTSAPMSSTDTFAC
jgi:hypothetical protein